jgi:hypothetical protein
MTVKIDQIGKEIIQKTGIDFEKYRKPELISTIVDVSTFIINPLASVPIFLKSFVFTFITIICILAVITKTGDINMAVIILMFFIGLVGFPFIGSSIAVKRVGNKIIEDIKNALNIAMDISIEIIKDLKKMNLKRIPPVTDIIRGVVFVVLIPSLETVITEKITFLGKPVSWIMEKTLFNFTKAFVGVVDKIIPEKKAVEGLDQALKQDIQKLQEMNPSEESKMLNVIEKARDMIASLLLETVMPKILLPFTILFYGSSGMTCAAIFLVYLLLA